MSLQKKFTATETTVKYSPVLNDVGIVTSNVKWEIMNPFTLKCIKKIDAILLREGILHHEINTVVSPPEDADQNKGLRFIRIDETITEFKDFSGVKVLFHFFDSYFTKTSDETRNNKHSILKAALPEMQIAIEETHAEVCAEQLQLAGCVE